MQITIDSKDLLEIFIEAGIGQTDAKALILDIIMLQENPPKPAQKLIKPTPKPHGYKEQTTSTEHIRLKPVTQLPSQQAPEEEIPEESYSIEEEEEEAKPVITRVNSKTMSRPNFSSFGGDSTGLKG